MTLTFQLYSAARDCLTDLMERLTPRELYYIGGPDPLPAPLTLEEEQALVARLQEDDGTIRRTLIERNLRLVVFIARKFENTGVMLEDLISIGTIGLIKAVNTFDPQKKIKLATYASRCIENEVLMFLRRFSRTRVEVSLDEPLKTDWDGNELLLSDVLGTDGDIVCRGMEESAERQMLFAALSHLSPREQKIMNLRFGLGGQPEMTQKEVADVLGISQSYISRLEKRILHRLHGEMMRASGWCDSGTRFFTHIPVTMIFSARPGGFFVGKAPPLPPSVSAV